MLTKAWENRYSFGLLVFHVGQPFSLSHTDTHTLSAPGWQQQYLFFLNSLSCASKLSAWHTVRTSYLYVFIVGKHTQHNINHYSVYGSVALSAFTLLCSHHHHPFLELHLPKWPSVPLNMKSPSPFSSSLWKPHSTFCLYEVISTHFHFQMNSLNEESVSKILSPSLFLNNPPPQPYWLYLCFSNTSFPQLLK